MLVESKPLHQIQENPDAEMENVLQALALDQIELAENLLARVSKKLVIQRIEHHRDCALASFAEYKRVLAGDLNFDDAKFIFVSSRTLWLRVDEDSAARMMETTVCGIGNEIGFRFNDGGKGYLIEALSTSLKRRPGGLWAFDWKQRYCLA